ncbi:MAG: hypothetical protein E7052_06755 [Lentisphaerae bacterium]|nr:hypothetical protein [Lentisphaerota bacterium]
MIDLKILRENPELIKQNCARRGSAVNVDTLLALDVEYRNLLSDVENMRSERNRLSKECKDNPAARDQVRELKERISASEGHLNRLEDKISAMASFLPNCWPMMCRMGRLMQTMWNCARWG